MLTKDGFKRKAYGELFEDMSLKAQELFGENINLSVYSPMGIMLRLYAHFLAAVWMLAEQVYNSGYVSKTEGVQLDRLGANRGVLREEAAESYVELTFVGMPGVVLDEGRQYTGEHDVIFALTERVQLDGTGDGVGRAVSIETGVHTLVPAGSITEQVEPLEGLVTVTNNQASAGGRNREEDHEYKLRIPQSSGGKGTPSAIRSALQAVSGVRAANVVINNTNATDSFGNPPKSVHAYLLGGDSQAIAQTLWDSVGGGIETIGAQTASIEDISGIPHPVHFDFATTVSIAASVTLTTNSSFPTDGQTQVKDALVSLIGGTDSNGIIQAGYTMGQDVIYSQLFGRIYSIPGITDVSLQIGIEGQPLGTSNITIGPDEVAATTADLIGVN